MKTIIVGARGSKLALWQAEWVIARLRQRHPDIAFRVQAIHTHGDEAHDRPRASLGRGIFVKKIEDALSAREVDLAVHSLKDLPTELPPGLVLAAVTERADPRDVLVTRHACRLDALPLGACLGTSSPRRAAQLLAYRPDFQIRDLRGNLDTRLRKAVSADYDGAVLAAAGLERLGLTHLIAEYITPQVILPAPGQGALGIETRADDDVALSLAAVVEDTSARAATTAERAFLHRLRGGCAAATAAFAQVNGTALHLRGLVATLDGRRAVRGEMTGAGQEAERLGVELAERLLAEGAAEILA
jgi:hydroxymethylbilane synthase